MNDVLALALVRAETEGDAGAVAAILKLAADPDAAAKFVAELEKGGDAAQAPSAPFQST